MSRREHGSGKPVSSEELLRQEAAVYLSPTAEKQLANIMERREGVESALQRMDVDVYDLESEFLKHCVSFGGSLFDGFGLERRSNAHRNPVAVLTPLHSSSHAGGGASISGNFETGRKSGSPPGSPFLTATASGEQFRTYQFLTNSLQSSCGNGGSESSASNTVSAVFQVGSKGASAPAFHYRIHFFSPSERVFSACSVGALSRVEIAKSTVDSGTSAVRGVARSTVRADTTAAAGRRQGCSKRGRHGGSVSAAFARQPDALPLRRRRREGTDDDGNGNDNTARDGGFACRRRHGE